MSGGLVKLVKLGYADLHLQYDSQTINFAENIIIFLNHLPSK